MSNQQTQPETLDIPEVERHPMWTAPSTDFHRGNKLQPFQTALLTEIANRLIPFDGRPHSEFVIHYCQIVYEAVYDVVDFRLSANYMWTVGAVITKRVKLVERLESMGGHDQEIKVITRLSEDFVHAILQEVK